MTADNDDLLGMLASINELLKVLAKSAGHTEFTVDTATIE